jgi:hypothetical protein
VVSCLPVSIYQAYRRDPRQSEVDDRKDAFDDLNDFVQRRNGFVISIPGERIVTIEVLPDSGLPAELTALGYDLTEAPAGERILSGAIVEHFTLTSSGAFEPLSPNSTKAIAQSRRHAGIVKTRRFTFDLR